MALGSGVRIYGHAYGVRYHWFALSIAAPMEVGGVLTNACCYATEHGAWRFVGGYGAGCGSK